MSKSEIKILGFSETTLTMLFDIFESNDQYPNIEIINNIGYEPTKEYLNKKFNVKISSNIDIDSSGPYILGVAQKTNKLKILNYFSNLKSEEFVTVISKNTDISSTTKIGYGNIINGMVCIAGQTNLDDFVFVNRNVSIGHHTTIGKYTTINPGVNIAGNVTIGENCQIGIGVNVFDGVKIGNNVIIGGGSVVTKDIPDNVVAYGTPCKVIKKII